MKLIYCLMIFFCPLVSRAQTTQVLNVGDEIPDISLSPIVNYAVSETCLSAFKGKLLLLDFMTTGCVSCIEALPRFDSLQKKYKAGLKIFLVTPESENRVKSFLKRKNISSLNLSIISGDTTLSKIFPHTYISHDVLIKNRRVVAITYPEYIIDKNVAAVIENEPVNFPVKRDLTTFQYGKDLLHPNEKIIPDLSYPSNVWYSSVTGYLDNVPESYKTYKDSVKNTLHISMINVPVIDLYKRVLYGRRLAPAFIQLKVANISDYSYNPKNGYYHDWLEKNAYCYDARFPLTATDSVIKNKMAADLDFFLGLHGRVINKEGWCWVITNSKNASTVAQKNVTDSAFLEPSHNASLDDIIYFMNKDFGNTPAIDLTGEGERRLPGLNWSDCTNIPVLKKKLRENGYSITHTQRMLTILEIRENVTPKL
jgi:thiol-disulfide isomerase/thioredoxin